jgi:uncharacterized protein
MIFVDTSAWLAVSDANDGNHASALRFHRELLKGGFGRMITTDFVLDESLTLIRRRVGAESVARFLQGVEESRSVQTIWVTADHFREARGVFLQQGSRSWSFTDCTSFVVMRELGIQTAFGFDGDFREAGFRVQPD